MLFRNEISASLVLVSLLLASAGSFAALPDCSKYTEELKNICDYKRIELRSNGGLFVVGEDQDLDLSNALPNEDFFAYTSVPDNDTIDLYLNKDTSQVMSKSMTPVTSGDANAPYVRYTIKGYYPCFNIAVGTAVSESDDPAIAKIYNFYAPAIKYCLDKDCKKVVSDTTLLSMDVGEDVTVYVQAYIPIGPDSSKSDDSLTKTFYINTSGASDNLIFSNTAGEPLKLVEGKGSRLDVEGGKATFVVGAKKAVTDGSSFTLGAYEDGVNKDGQTQFIVNEGFPGNLQFVNPDMPTLDSASIFDTNGDGIGDSIIAWYGGKMDSIKVESFSHNWPNGEDFKKHQGEWTQKGSVVQLTSVKADIPEDVGNGVLKSTVKSVNTGKSEELSTEITDRIGPVIRNAVITLGQGGDKDTLVLRFNKDMDSSWAKGEDFILNGSKLNAKAIAQEGNLWTIVVDSGVVHVGDSISLVKGGKIIAADGNKAGKNNPAIVQNSNAVYATNENNGFYDRNGDGRMDSASVGFELPITREFLDDPTTVLTFYWLKNDGTIDTIVPNKKDLQLSEDGLVVGFGFDADDYDIKNSLTSIDTSYTSNGGKYGYAELQSVVVDIDGNKDTVLTPLGMHDRLPPVIVGTFLQPESYEKFVPDQFTITFSEPVAHSKKEDIDKNLSFYVDGEWVNLSYSKSAVWSDDGTTLTLYLGSGTKLTDRMNPADSIKYDNFESGFEDMNGNMVSAVIPAVMVQGDPRVLMQSTSLASLERGALLADKAAFTERFVAQDVSMDDEMKKSLGVLLDISFATILKEDSASSVELNLEDIGLHWELFVSTNLGNYVASSSGTIKCDDKSFNKNCFENPRKLYLRWNMRADGGRKAGVGVYVAQLKINVFGAKKSFKVEKLYNWGIRPGTDGLSLGE